MRVISLGKYDAIFDMLGEMNVPERSSAIFDWSIGGQIIYDFIWLRKQLDSGKDIAEYFGTVQPRNIGFEGTNIICYGLIFVFSKKNMFLKQKNFNGLQFSICFRWIFVGPLQRGFTKL